MTAVRKDRPPREPWRWWMLPVLVYAFVNLRLVPDDELADWQKKPQNALISGGEGGQVNDELDFSGAYEALTQVEKYSQALKDDPADAWLRRCRDGWAERLSRCLVLNGVPYVGSGEPSLPVPKFKEDA